MIKRVFPVVLAISSWFGFCQDCPNKMIFQHPKLDGIEFNSGEYFTKREAIVLEELQSKYHELKASTKKGDSLKGFSLDGSQISIDMATHTRYLSPASRFTDLIEDINPDTINPFHTANAMNSVETHKKRVTRDLLERGMSQEEIDKLIILTSDTHSFNAFLIYSHYNFQQHKRTVAMNKQWSKQDLQELAYADVDLMSYIYARWADDVFEMLSRRVTKIIVSYLCEQSAGGGSIYYWVGQVTEEHLQLIKQELCLTIPFSLQGEK